MFDRFTDRARKVMGLARQEAQRFNHDYIGTEKVAGPRGKSAFLYRAGTTHDLHDLTVLDPALGWTLELANGINAAGAIVGQGSRDGQPRALLLTPGE